MNKRLILTSILLGALTMSTVTYGGVKNIVIQNNLVQVDTEEHALYPLRKVCDALGIQISSVTDEHIVLKQNNNVVTLNRNNQYLKNSKGYFVTQSIPVQKDGQTYVALDVLEKMFGYTSVQTDTGLVVSKAANFSLPAPTQTGQRLHNDLNYIELLEEKIDISYYRAAIQTGIKEYNIETITAARQKISQDLNMIGEMEAYLQSDTGKAAIASYKGLLNAYNLILNNAFNLNVRDMMNYFIGVMEAEDHVKSAKSNFTKVLEKNATKL